MPFLSQWGILMKKDEIVFTGTLDELYKFLSPIKVDNYVSNLFNEKRYQDLVYELRIKLK